jgi:sugar phosphate isomerase/epimerase
MPAAEQIGFSIASIPGHTFAEILDFGRELGFSAIEILAFEGERHSGGSLAGFAFAERPASEWRALGRRLEGFDRISAHAPFIQTFLLSANAGVAREAFRQVRCTIEGIAAVGGNVCTVHLNARPFLTIREIWEQAVDVLGRLGDIGARHGVTIAMETGFPATVEDYCGLIEAARHARVGACIDVGHIFHYYPRELRGTEEGVRTHNNLLEEIVLRLGEKVAILHLHDNRPHDFRDHRAPGRGIIDFARLMRALDASAFPGAMVLELEEPDALEALAESRDFLAGRIQD